ncbi:MAG: SHOCT domain-containing protein [Anaerovoracaceae bacterium]|jgi:hypothetical protein
MVNIRSEVLFISTMNLAKKMLDEGMITEEEYRQIILVFSEKYSPIIGTITLDLEGTQSDV